MKIVRFLRDSVSGLSAGRAEQRVVKHVCCCSNRGMGSATTALVVEQIVGTLK